LKPIEESKAASLRLFEEEMKESKGKSKETGAPVT
jgi:hypothetical protein